MNLSRKLTALFAVLLCCSLSACRSAFVETTLHNNGDTPMRLIEIDYPSASFGTQMLAPQAVYHYRFKVQGSGAITLSYTGADGKTHSATGPTLYEDSYGSLTIVVDDRNNVSWTERLTTAK